MRTNLRLSISVLLCTLATVGCHSSPSVNLEGVSTFEQEIVRDLSSRDASVRTAAASRVAFFKISAGAPQLVKMLANDQIYSCGEDPMGHPVTCSEAGAAAEALRTLGTDAVEPLIYAAHHARPGVRAMAVGILASIGDPRANEVMLAALRDRDAKVRLAAMAWPAPTSDLSVQSRIALLLHDPDERVRTQAVAQLEEFANDRRVVNAFRVAGKDSSSDVRNAVARSMEK